MDLMLWIDFETSGVKPSDYVLEAGWVVTDLALNELGRGETVIGFDAATVQRMMEWCDPVVRDMHTVNGLWAECAAASGTLADCESQILRVIDEHRGGEQVRVVLCGSGVSHFDRRIVEARLPHVSELLVYWNYDIGVVRRFLERAQRNTFVDDPGRRPHRALDDALSALAQAKVFEEEVGWYP